MQKIKFYNEVHSWHNVFSFVKFWRNIVSTKSKSVRSLSNDDLADRLRQRVVVIEEVIERLERARQTEDDLDEAETKIGDLEAGITEAREKLGELI